MEKETYQFQAAEEVLLAAVDQAIGHAVKSVGRELQSLGVDRSAQDYFADVALRYLFLRLCRADLVTNSGGDPETAWKIIYVGRSVARYWERERGSQTLRKKKERREDVEMDKSERRQLALSAKDLALRSVIRVLVDSARVLDPKISDKMEAEIEARHARLEPASDADREFTEKARSYLSVLVGQRSTKNTE